MTEQEKPKGWGSRERMALVAEVLRWKRIARRLAELIADGEITPEDWIRRAEQAVAVEISPKG